MAIFDDFLHKSAILAISGKMWRFLAKTAIFNDFLLKSTILAIFGKNRANLAISSDISRFLMIFGEKAPFWRFPVKFGDFWRKIANLAISGEIW